MDTSTDVRIIDDRHVFLPQTAQVARYGPTPTGPCRATMGGPVFTAGPLRLVSFPLTANLDSTETRYTTFTLVCDPIVGDYTDVLVTGRSLSNQYASTDTSLVQISRTAGVYVTLRAVSNDHRLETYRVTVEPPVPSSDLALTGEITASAFEPATAGGSFPVIATGPRLIRGAVTWITKREKTRDLAVWLADQRGARAVGTIAIGSAVPSPRDPDIALTDASLSWNDGAERKSVPVSPASTPIDTGAPARPGA